MTTSKESNAENNPDFVLKHRITGAAFLIFFGVLFLPWLLGAPSEANKEFTGQNSENNDQLTPDQIEQELLTVVDDAELEDVEVYVSKITPLDGIPIAEPEPKPEIVEPEVNEQQSSEAEQQEPEIVEEPQVAQAPEPKDTEIKRAEETPVVVEAPSAPVVENSVDVGWVVQVGVFTDRSGAEKVVVDLESRGFTPSTTIVDTNQGKASATRVWLGPYAQRADAAKSMSTLKEKTGSDGFIRAYP